MSEEVKKPFKMRYVLMGVGGVFYGVVVSMALKGFNRPIKTTMNIIKQSQTLLSMKITKGGPKAFNEIKNFMTIFRTNNDLMQAIKGAAVLQFSAENNIYFGYLFDGNNAIIEDFFKDVENCSIAKFDEINFAQKSLSFDNRYNKLIATMRLEKEIFKQYGKNYPLFLDVGTMTNTKLINMLVPDQSITDVINGTIPPPTEFTRQLEELDQMIHEKEEKAEAEDVEAKTPTI